MDRVCIFHGLFVTNLLTQLLTHHIVRRSTGEVSTGPALGFLEAHTIECPVYPEPTTLISFLELKPSNCTY